MTTSRIFQLSTALAALLAAGAIGPNDLILKYPGARPGPVTTTAYVSFGHKLPIDEPLDDERFGGLFLVSAGAAPRRLETAPTGYRAVQVKFEAPGAHWLASVNRTIFSSQLKDAQGVLSYARVPRDAAPKGANVVETTQIHGFAKTLLYVQGEGAAAAAPAFLAQPLGHTLELVPLGNPAAAKVGDSLAVQVLFRGKPYVEDRVELVAEHVAGAYLGKAGKWTGETDRQGRATIPLGLPGPWQVLVTVLDTPPAGLKGKADVVRYRATLVFEVPGANYGQ
jgi:hypothetical protein